MTTQPNAKRIFVLDDSTSQFDTYVRQLKLRRFHVRGAKNREEFERVLESDESFDLLLLDMNLEEDPGFQESNIYGSDVGMQLAKKQATWPPEVLTMTAYHLRIDLWRRAFAVGAAAFLEKNKLSVETIINHVYVMLLRRAVSLSNPRCKEVINEVLSQGWRERRLLEEFFRRLVVPEFDACLGSPFIMVLEDANADGALDAPPPAAGVTLREQIVELVGKASYYVQVMGISGPLELQDEVFRLEPLPARPSSSEIFLSAQLAGLLETETRSDGSDVLTELLEEAAFISLQLTPDVRLGLLLVKERTHFKRSKDQLPPALAKLLMKYSLDTLRITSTNLVERWKNEQKIKQVQFQELGRFCDYVGAEAKRITFDVKTEGLLPEENASFQRLNLLADELFEAGEFLDSLGRENVYPARRFILREVVQSAWDSLARGGAGPSGVLSFRGDCGATVLAAEEELLFIFSRLLHWLVSFYEDDLGMTLGVSVECRLEGGEVEIALESESVRLHKILRDSLFIPMTQRIDYERALEGKGPKLFLSLYLTKSLLERRYQGSLADRSDSLPGDLGHRLVIRMPVING